MDKKVLIGLGLLGAVGLIWYFKKKSASSSSDSGDMLRSGTDLEAPAEEPAMDAPAMDAPVGGGGGGGVPAPAMMAEMAKEELKEKMSLGGIDMTSPKAEKGAMATAMVQAMMAQGKTPPKELVQMMQKAPLPNTTKQEMAVKTMNTMTAMMGKGTPSKAPTPALKAPAIMGNIITKPNVTMQPAPKAPASAPKAPAPAPKAPVVTMQSIPKMAAPAPKAPAPAPKAPAPVNAIMTAPKPTAKFDGLDDFDFDGNF